MRITEIDLNIMSAPQSYYLAQGISKDLNFSTGLPALFERMYGMKEKIEASYVDDYTDNVDIELGEAILVDNVFNLIVKEVGGKNVRKIASLPSYGNEKQ